MSWTYTPGTNLGNVRLLVADTDSTNQIFSDAEVEAALQMESSQGLYVSGGGATAGGPAIPLIPQVYSVYRAAALLLDSLASNSARLGGVTKLLDVTLDVGESANRLRSQASNYREIEARMGNFAIAELVTTTFSFRDRLLNSWARQGY